MLAKILLVVPFCLVRIEFCAALAYLVDTERLYEFLHGKEFLLCSGVPSKHCQEVDKCLREVSVLTISVIGFTFAVLPV